MRSFYRLSPSVSMTNPACQLDPADAFTTDPACLLDSADASHDRPRLPFGFRRRLSRPTPAYCTLTTTLLTIYFACQLDIALNLDKVESGCSTASPEPLVKMALCLYCNTALNNEVQYYRISELGFEFNEIIEDRLHQEVDENGLLCTGCFNTVAALLNENQVDRNLRTGRCVWCDRSLARRQTHRLEAGLIYNEVAIQISPREIPPNGCVCHACWMAATRNVARQAQIDQRRNEVVQEDTPLRYGTYKRTPDTASRCFVRGCINEERLTVPESLKYKLLSKYQLYVTPMAKICREHLSIYNWDFVIHMDYISLLTQTQIVTMLQLLRNVSVANVVMNYEDIDNMSDSNFSYWIGLTKTQFHNIIEQLGDFININNHKTILAAYLMKLRTGEPNLRLAQLLGTSERTVGRMLKKCRQYMLERYVPLHLGINHISRNDLINRNLIIPEGLFGNSESRKPITICDGTYLYLQKSSNYLFQKKSYSLHKYRNLAKPFLMVATDGHIVDVFGPYAATTSDADIIKQLFQNDETQLRQFFQSGDIFILDRGFRDALSYLNSLNYVIHKPESLAEGEHQLSTIKANKSRLVTLCRWVVEVVNGRFKRDFKLFRNVYFNNAATHLMDDFKISAAIINNYHPVIVNRPDASMILDRALQRIDLPNYLADYVIQENINRRRTSFVRIDGEIPHLSIFPRMEMNDLILFALGIYQIKQARSYYGEHIRENGSFIIEVSEVPDTTNITPNESQAQQLIRGRIKSRHQSQKIYFTYILINSWENDWTRKISGYYCNCLVGMRTVGCCAHVMTLVWYLGWARYQDNIEAPATFLDGILVREDMDYRMDEDE